MIKFGYDRRLPLVTCLVAVLCFSLITAFTTPAWSQASASDQQQGTAAGAGMQAAAAVSTILYFPFKGAFAIGGGIVGGLAYLFSGGSEQTAKSIWILSNAITFNMNPLLPTFAPLLPLVPAACALPASITIEIDNASAGVIRRKPV